MAKQWKIGTAYVEVEARLKLATQMQAQAQQVNAAAKKIGESASKSMTAAMSVAGKEQFKLVREAERVAAMFKNIGQWSAGQQTPEQKASRLGLLNMSRRPDNQGFPTLSGYQAATQQKQLYIAYSENQKKVKDWNKVFDETTTHARVSYGKLAAGFAAAEAGLFAYSATVLKFAEAASPDVVNSFWKSIELFTVQIGTFVVPLVQQFGFVIQSAAKAVEQWRKGEISFLQMFTGGKPERFKMDIDAKPQMTGIAEAWRQAQLAGAYGMLHPQEMEIRAEQYRQRNLAMQRTASMPDYTPSLMGGSHLIAYTAMEAGGIPGKLVAALVVKVAQMLMNAAANNAGPGLPNAASE